MRRKYGTSRGGALHTRPDKKMGRYRSPEGWFIEGRHPSLVRMLKRHAAKKRRQRDHDVD